MTGVLQKPFVALLMCWVLALPGCSPVEEGGLEGTLLFQDQPLAEAQVEVYLKADKDRSIQPFMVAMTSPDGRYRLALPQGRYFVIGKKRESTDDGRTRMLMAESPGNPHQVAGGVTRIAPFNLREMGREGLPAADAETGVSGRVTFQGAPVPRAYVYIYPEADGGLTGPSYGEAVQTGQDGSFRIDLPAGHYSLVARKRVDGSRSGALAPGDLNGLYPGNPLTIERGVRLELGDFALAEVDAEVHAKRQAEGVFPKTATRLSGRVADIEGVPVEDVYVFAYLDSRMVGKPVHMSVPTGADGRFDLFLSVGGTYYLGARSAFGGPLEPGEWVGTFDRNPDHRLEVQSGASDDIGTITVREFW